MRQLIYIFLHIQDLIRKCWSRTTTNKRWLAGDNTQPYTLGLLIFILMLFLHFRGTYEKHISTVVQTWLKLQHNHIWHLQCCYLWNRVLSNWSSTSWVRLPCMTEEKTLVTWIHRSKAYSMWWSCCQNYIHMMNANIGFWKQTRVLLCSLNKQKRIMKSLLRTTRASFGSCYKHQQFICRCLILVSS
mgnify:CR=1 FL=1